jgi:hypothetical protein
MNAWAAFWIFFCASQHLAGDDRNVALTKQNEPQKILNWITFDPAEIGMGNSARLIADVE